MPKKKPQPLQLPGLVSKAEEDAFTRLDNLYHFSIGEQPNSEIKQVIHALFLAQSDEEYFKRIETI